MRVEIPETREGLAHIALIRREELDGFVEGLFGKEQSLELPERAHRLAFRQPVASSSTRR